MEFERIKGIVVVPVPAGDSLYAESSRDFVKALDQLVEGTRQGGRTQGIRGVLVVQGPALHDWTRGWIEELRTEALLKDIAERLQHWRWLLGMIRYSPVPWGFFSGASCFGSGWELALSCRRRYWFAPEAQVGFPDIEIGAFPPGGLLESLNRRLGKTRERWQSQPVVSAREACREDLIHYCVHDPDWQPRATGMFDEILSNQAPALLPPQPEKRGGAAWMPKPSSGEQAAEVQIAAVWRAKGSDQAKAPAAWDYSWQLFRERDRFARPGDLGRIISHIAARHYLSPEYVLWLNSRHTRGLCAEARPAAEPGAIRLVVDLDYLVPPTECLVRMLAAGFRVMFTASEAGSLASGLSLLYARLEKHLGTERARGSWRDQVAWHLSVAADPRQVVTRWSVDDRLEIHYQRKSWSMLRLEGNSAAAPAGMAEWSGRDGGASVAKPVARLIDLVIEGVIATVEHGTPTACVVRAVFVEEIIRFASRHRVEPGQVVETLKAAGWGFAGDEEAWDRFLKTRPEFSSADFKRYSALGNWSASTEWDIGSWKQVRVVARKLQSEMGAVDAPALNRTHVSNHFATLTVLIIRMVRDAGVVVNPAMTDALVASALGFPASLGTPLAWMEQRGHGRVQFNIARTWPALFADGTGKGMESHE